MTISAFNKFFCTMSSFFAVSSSTSHFAETNLPLNHNLSSGAFANHTQKAPHRSIPSVRSAKACVSYILTGKDIWGKAHTLEIPQVPSQPSQYVLRQDVRRHLIVLLLNIALQSSRRAATELAYLCNTHNSQ